MIPKLPLSKTNPWTPNVPLLVMNKLEKRFQKVICINPQTLDDDDDNADDKNDVDDEKSKVDVNDNVDSSIKYRISQKIKWRNQRNNITRKKGNTNMIDDASLSSEESRGDTRVPDNGSKTLTKSPSQVSEESIASEYKQGLHSISDDGRPDKVRRHLPPGSGQYSVGCVDLMDEDTEEGSFCRLFYPVEKTDIYVSSKQIVKVTYFTLRHLNRTLSSNKMLIFTCIRIE